MDGLKKTEQKPLVGQLNKIPALRLDAAAMEMIQPSYVDKVKELSEKTQQNFQKLIEMLDPPILPKSKSLRR